MAQLTSIPSPDDIGHTPGCSHHWVILPATGPESQGTCQLCGEVRAFKNYVEGATWGNSRRAGQASAQPAVKPLPVEPAQNEEEEE